MPERGGPKWSERKQGEGQDQSGGKGVKTSSTIATNSTVCSCSSSSQSSKSISSRSTASTRSSSRSSRSSSLSSKASEKGVPSSLGEHNHHPDKQYCYCSSTSKLLDTNRRHLTWATTSTGATSAAAAAEQEALEEEAQLVNTRASFTARAALRQLFARIGLRRGRLGGRLDPYTSFLSQNSSGQRGGPSANSSSSAASRFLPVLRNLKLQRGVSAVASSRHEPNTMSFLFRLVQYVLPLVYYQPFPFQLTPSNHPTPFSPIITTSIS